MIFHELPAPLVASRINGNLISLRIGAFVGVEGCVAVGDTTKTSQLAPPQLCRLPLHENACLNLDVGLSDHVTKSISGKSFQDN